MKLWQVILIIFIYDTAKSLWIEFLNWKDESSSSSTTSETDKAPDNPDKATNGDTEQESTKNDLEVIIKEVLKAYQIDTPTDLVDRMEEAAVNSTDVPYEFLYPTQKLKRCKYCEHWKDSDGKYRRGRGAESKCPINNDTVYRGEGNCYMFSPKGPTRIADNMKNV